MPDKYKCKVCNYSTKDASNYNKHCKSKKHIEKSNTSEEDKNFSTKSHRKYTVNTQSTKNLCDYCGSNFSRLDSLKRHENICSKKKLNDVCNEAQMKEYKKEVDHKNELYNKEVKRNKDQQKEIEYYKNILVAAGNMLQSTVSSLTYANDIYCDAPSLKKVKFKQVKQIKDCSDDDLISEIFSAHNNKTLGKYIGDIIVKIYKKEDPTEQSLWNTDVNRLTYLIKKYIYDEESKWIIDKRGVDIDKNIINPILDDVRIMAIKYQADTNLDDDIDNEKVLLINTIFVKLLSDIDNKKVHKDVLKYISSHFYLKNKKAKKCKTIVDE